MVDVRTDKPIKKATFEIQDYTAVIPKIQNIYPVEEGGRIGWSFGFKYESGVFEFFHYETATQAEYDWLRLLTAIESYYEVRG